jgi:hypothetical protein
MDMKTLFIIGGLVMAGVYGFKAIRFARRQAASQGEDEDDPLVVGWYVLLLPLGVGYGFWAARTYLRSLPNADYGFGGIAFLLIALVVFAIGFGVAAAAVAWIGRNMSTSGRAGVLAAAVAMLVGGLVMPMQKQAQQAAVKASSDEQAWFESNYSNMQATMKDIAHAPPGVAPAFLGVQREGDVIHITNNATATYIVSAMFILPRGRQWERCWAGVEAKACTADAGSCSYHLAKDGTKVYSEATVRNTQPRLLPGDRKTFTAACDARFAAAPYELRVYDAVASKYVFKSDSGFVPDTPQLWK